ncbi:MAG: SGNH/GDSL hydrolase family protein [Candidatus Marinimicrobia bacterium]|nr:SGNH/GDSL hydrolase family protein [Candidatus Neomarinimicrobiota bacterium]
MKTVKAKLFIFIIVTQLLIIFFLGFNYLSKKNQKILGEVTISPIEKEKLTFPTDSELKHFYEPECNIVVEDKPEWLPYVAKYKYNSDCLNERFDYDVEKPKGVFRIMTLGDSFTFGHFVNTEDNYPEQLEELLNNQLSCQNIEKFEVINLGVMGYDIEYSVHRFKTRGAKYQPDLILWFLKGDDFWQIEEITSERVQQIEEEISRAGLTEEYIQESGYHFAYNMAEEELLEKYGEDWILDYQKKLLSDFFQEYHGKTVLFTHSDEGHKIKNLINNFINQQEKTFFFVVEYNLFDKLPDGHYSVKGYTTLANKLLNYLINEKIIFCD